MKKLLLFTILSILSTCVFGQSITLDPTSTSPAGVQVNTDLAFRKIIRETVKTTYSSYNRQNASVVIFEGGGDLQGIADGQDGVVLYVYAGASSNLLIAHEKDNLSANRIITHTGAHYNIFGGGGVMLMYDGLIQRWRVLAVDQPAFGWGLTGNAGTLNWNFIGTTDAKFLAFRTDNIERLRISATGLVGIGTGLPDTQLHVANGTAGSVTPPANTISTIENNNDAYLSVLTPAANVGGIIFGNPTANAAGSLLYSQTLNKMSFKTNTVERMMIDGTGKVGIGTTSPNAKLEVAGTFAISGKTAMTGNQNNFNLNGKSVIKVSGGGTYTLTGIAGGADGMIVHIMVITSTDLILAEDSPSSSLGNRIVTGSSAGITIPQGGGATLIYDGDTGYWKVIGVKG